MTTPWERRERAREQKLKQIEDQVEDGSLVIRKMTDAERKANPPKPRPEKRPRRGEERPTERSAPAREESEQRPPD